jgi:hypothetical protein
LDDNSDTCDLIINVEINRIAEVDIQYGASRNDWKLIDGDYYGIFIKKPAQGCVQFFGTNAQSFSDGNLYSSTTGALTPLNKSLSFMIHTFMDSTLKKVNIKQDSYSPKSSLNLMIVNPNTFEVKKYLGAYTFETCESVLIEYDYSLPEIIEIDSENHLYGYYQDSFNSTASFLHVCARFHFSRG